MNAQVILADIALLGLKPDEYTFTSNHFDTLIGLCRRMITEGKAYADDTEPELMKKEREERVESKNCNNSKLLCKPSLHRSNEVVRCYLISAMCTCISYVFTSVRHKMHREQTAGPT